MFQSEYMLDRRADCTTGWMLDVDATQDDRTIIGCGVGISEYVYCVLDKGLTNMETASSVTVSCKSLNSYPRYSSCFPIFQYRGWIPVR